MSEQGPSFLRVAATLVTEAGLAIGGAGCASTTANASAEAEKQLNPIRPSTTEVLTAPPTQTPLPTEIAVMASPTAEPTSTPEPTATSTEVPTVEPTPEIDFSDIHFNATLEEALDNPMVSRKDVFDGKLIALAKSKAEPWLEGVEAAPISLQVAQGDSGFVRIVTKSYEDPSEAPFQKMGYYRVDEGAGFRGDIVVIQRIKMANGQDGYLQFSSDYNSLKKSTRELETFKNQPYYMPYYKTPSIEINLKFIANSEKNGIHSSPQVGLAWQVDYFEKVQPMLDEWLATGVIPEELSLYPLEMPITDRYN